MSLDKTYNLALIEQQKGLPRGITAPQIMQESAGNPNAVSPKGAAGIMQIMPDTARDPGFGVRPLQGWDGKDPRTAPVEEQIRFGTDYMAAMNKRYGGDVEKTLAAYNAGPGAVDNAGGVPNFKETQDYVKKITGKMGNGIQVASADPNQAFQMAAANNQDIDAEIAALEKELGLGQPVQTGNTQDIDAEIAALEAELGVGQPTDYRRPEDGVPMPDYDPAQQMPTVNPKTFNPQFFGPGIPIPVNADGAAFTGQVLGRAAADIAGAPVDLFNFAQSGTAGLANIFLPESMELNPLPIETGSSDSIANAFGSIAKEAGYPVQDPNTLEDGLDYGYNMGRFATSGAAGGAGMAARANKLQKAGKELGPLTSMYAERPVRQVVDDAIAGAGAGYGATVAENNFEDSPMAQLFATLLGGMGASVGSRVAESAVTYPFRKGYEAMPQQLPNGETTSRRTQNDAARYIQDIASDPKAASKTLKENIDVADQNNMTRPSTGVASDDIGLSIEENRRRTRDGQPYLEKDQKIRTEVSESVNSLRDPNADIEAPQQVARQERDRQMLEAKDASNQAQDNLNTAKQQQVNIERDTEAMVEPVRAELGREAEASKQLDKQIGTEGALGERTKVKNKAFDDAAGGQVVNVKPLVKSVEKVEERVNKLGGMGQETGLPGDFVARVKTLSEAGENVPLKDVSGVRKNITSAIARARQAGNFDLVDDLSTLKKDINDFVDNEASFEVAQKYYREEYAPFFAEGYGKEFRDTVQKSTERTGKADPGRIAEIFLNGTPDAAADLKRIVDIAPDPKAAAAAVERYMAADFAKTLGDKPSPRAMKNWIKNRSAQLDQFPEVKKKFETLQKNVGSQESKQDYLRGEISRLETEFKRAEDNINATERRINKGVLGTLINSDPDRYVKELMGGKDRLQKLDEVNTLIGNNKQAKDGLKRAVTDYLIDSIEGTNTKMTDNVDGPIQYAAIARVMKNNEDALAKVYSPAEMNTLRRSQKLLGQYGNLSKRATVGSDTAEKTKWAKVALETTLRLKYGVLKAGGIMRTIKDTLAQVNPNSKYNKMDRLVGQAMLDPELAAHLLDVPVSEISKPKWNKKLQFLISGSASGRAMQPDESEDETDE